MSSNSPTLPEDGDLVAGRYRIIEEIGRGGYGAVYRARQEAIDRRVALKFLLPDVADDPTEVERFRREIFHASGLEHPHTVTLYDYGKAPAGLVYVVMEFLEGINLYERIRQFGPVDPSTARVLLEQILGSLDEAHQRELVHRDLKPDNIYLCDTADDEIDCRVLDFGLSKFVGDPDSTMYRGPSLTEEGEICGTPQYMSPEHAYGENVTPAGDIYSLGLVMYEALVGRPPFTGNSPLDVLLKQVKEPLPELPEELVETPVGEFIRRATPKETDERFADAGEAIKWLLRQPAADDDEQSWTGTTPRFLQPAEQRDNEDEDIPPTIPVSPPDQPEPAESTAPPIETAEPTGLEEPTEEMEDDRRRAALEHFELRVAQSGLVGRDDTLEHLDDWLDNALGSGGILAVTGDDGVGKSTVLDTWCATLETRSNLHLLRGRHTPETSSLGGLEKLFEPVLDTRIDAPHLSMSSLEPKRALELGRLFDEARNTGDEARQAARRLVHGLTEELYRLSEHRPVVLAFDDLDAADPVTRQFFDNIHDSLTDRPRSLGVIVTARKPKSLRAWNRLDNSPATRHHLEPLDDSALAELLEQLVSVDDPLREGILKLSSGNPALLLHICRYLLERRDLVEYDADRELWALQDPTTPLTELVPVDLRQLVVERANHHLQNAEDEAGLRAILHRAVLLGDEFEADLLENILRAENREGLADRCTSLLSTLEDIGLLRRLEDSGRYGFARPLHRASLVRMVEHIDDWRPFHRHAADELIDRNDEPPFPARRIAVHLERAGSIDRALGWWIRAARRAESERRYRDALRLMHRSLRDPSAKSTDPEVLAEIHLREGRLARRIGEVGRAEDALRIATDYAISCQRADLRARAAELLADVILLQGRLDETEQLLDDVEDIYDVLDDPEGHHRVVFARSKLAVFRGNYETALELFDRLEDAPAAGNSPQLEARALIGRARCAFAAGNLDEAHRHARTAGERARELADRRTEANSLIEAAHIALYSQGVEAAESLAHQALTLGRRTNDILVRANAHLALGIALRRSTNLDRAHFHSDRARELHESTGHLYGILKDLLLSAELAWMEAEPERALLLGEDAARLHRDLGDKHGWALSTLYRTLFLVELGRTDEAEDLLDEILETIDSNELGLYEPNAMLYRGLISESRGAIDTAFDKFEQARSIAKRVDNREIISIAGTNRAKINLVLGNLDAAREGFADALEVAERLSHSYACMFALIGAALCARLDARPDDLRDYVTRLRTYVITPNAPDLRLRWRLRQLRALADRTPENPRRGDLLDAIDELRGDLSK